MDRHGRISGARRCLQCAAGRSLRARGEAWGGRSGHSTDCIIHPYFAVNETYLVFSTPHIKAYERVADPARDRWLKWVENEVWKTTRLETGEEGKAQADRRAKKEKSEREAGCVIKSVMSDEDIARCGP